MNKASSEIWRTGKQITIVLYLDPQTREKINNYFGINKHQRNRKLQAKVLDLQVYLNKENKRRIGVKVILGHNLYDPNNV